MKSELEKSRRSKTATRPSSPVRENETLDVLEVFLRETGGDLEALVTWFSKAPKFAGDFALGEFFRRIADVETHSKNATLARPVKEKLGHLSSKDSFREEIEITDRVSTWAGGRDQARLWYRSQPIPSFGDRTAEWIVKSGQADALRAYLDHIALGGFE